MSWSSTVVLIYFINWYIFWTVKSTKLNKANLKTFIRKDHNNITSCVESGTYTDVPGWIFHIPCLAINSNSRAYLIHWRHHLQRHVAICSHWGSFLTVGCVGGGPTPRYCHLMATRWTRKDGNPIAPSYGPRPLKSTGLHGQFLNSTGWHDP